MNTETTIESIIGFTKIIYPLSNPVVAMDKVSKGKYKCSVYMNKHGVPHMPLYLTNICNSQDLAFKEMLSIIEQYLLTKLEYEESMAISMIAFAKAKIKEHELEIIEAERMTNRMHNHIKRLRYLRDKK